MSTAARDRPVLETARLRLFELSADADAEFMVRLHNDAGVIRGIGDRNIRSADDARVHIRNGPAASYVRHGHGMYRLESKRDGASVGICGLIRRAGLDDPDLGYALLSSHAGHGYAYEAAAAVLADARQRLGLARILAIVSPENAASVRLLQKLGFGFATMTRLPGGDRQLQLFAHPKE